jgi:hypothetical protein
MIITDNKNGVVLSIDDKCNNQWLSIRAVLRNSKTDTDMTIDTILYLDEEQLSRLNSAKDLACIITEFFNLTLNTGDRIYNNPDSCFWQSAQLRSLTHGSEANIHFVATKEEVHKIYNSLLQLINNNENLVTHAINKSETKSVKITFSNQKMWKDGYGFMDIVVSSDFFMIRRSVETDMEDIKCLLNNISDYIEKKNSSLEIIYDHLYLNITRSTDLYSNIEGEICDFSWPECNKILFKLQIDEMAIKDAQSSLKMMRIGALESES